MSRAPVHVHSGVPTCMHAHHHSHANSLTLSTPPPPPASPACCQIKAWRAGHKRECVAKGAAEAMDSSRSAVQQAARPTSTLTADQRRLLTTLEGLEEEENWQGVVNPGGSCVTASYTTYASNTRISRTFTIGPSAPPFASD